MQGAHEYDTGIRWKDGVSDENVEALAEVTDDVAARLDYFTELYRDGEVERERIDRLVALGERALRAEGIWRDETRGLEATYEELESRGEEEISEVEDIQEVFSGEEHSLEDYSNEFVEEAEAYSSDPETRLWKAQERYREALGELRELEN
ncbi:hypothetical protein [Candidatus Nanohalovita haloferacivicina]|uniref:hypothetical protein n=1 Tax=Candidatus Nanohalovita haloferacivicina TaxID=2978046 RepID=UPI00325FD8A3|nr:hypothetical protein HBNXNv_0977 [Candidatus Nanohalobia archaeon BNXNv]